MSTTRAAAEGGACARHRGLRSELGRVEESHGRRTERRLGQEDGGTDAAVVARDVVIVIEIHSVQRRDSDHDDEETEQQHADGAGEPAAPRM